ncbi:MAG TPA: hypothetical protein ENJ17_02515 [Gammaproteobacteria bacterium]|nr:hypothetical protein [Gammaproteobacteria bacterium]
MLTAFRQQLLKDILSQPTAPFYEVHVLRCVTTHLQRAGVPCFEDPAGNLIVGVDSHTAYTRLLREKSDQPVRLFIAHMDHPGFHGVRWLDEKRLAVKWLGGSPVRHVAGARVWLSDGETVLGEGRLRKVKLLKQGWAMDTAELHLPQGPTPRPPARQLFGGLQFRAPYWRSGKRIYARAVDDLAGVFAIVATAIDLFKRGKAGSPPFLGLLTRAEEVGFVGAVRHFDLGWLDKRRRPLVCVSLEASRTLPGARVGKGPVVRLGDRRTTFDPGGLRLLSDLAERLLPGRHQRRIMDGGACEATAATAWGIPTIGLTLPLGNYHNQGFDGGMDCAKAQGPAPEFVHAGDVDGLLRLCRGLMRPNLDWRAPWAATQARLRKNTQRFKGYT